MATNFRGSLDPRTIDVDMREKIGRIGLVLVLAGCGSSAKNMTTGSAVCHTREAATANPSSGDGSTASGGDGGAANPGSGFVSWKENGMPQCAYTALAARHISTTGDMLEIHASTLGTTSVGIDVSSDTDLKGGTYACHTVDAAAVPRVTFDYVGSHGGGSALTSGCSVTIGFTADDAGVPHAQGTFSGTVASDAIDGGSYEITDGMFDLTMATTGG